MSHASKETKIFNYSERRQVEITQFSKNLINDDKSTTEDYTISLMLKKNTEDKKEDYLSVETKRNSLSTLELQKEDSSEPSVLEKGDKCKKFQRRTKHGQKMKKDGSSSESGVGGVWAE
jgi:dTDP-glucose pyrophosphorylase